MFSLIVKFELTVPVQRYLVPTPSTKGGWGGLEGEGGEGVEPISMISETVDSTTFNFVRPLGLSMRGKTLVQLMI